MGCDVSGEQLWSWIDRDAPELDEHLAICSTCRARAAKLQDEIGLLAVDKEFEIPMPKKIGPYVVKRVIGEGGQALVYEAEQPSPRRNVAVKVLKGGHLIDKNSLRKFRRESHALGRLNHPSIATVFEAGRTSDGLHYFAMELVDGQPLHTYVKEHNPTQRDILVFARKLCEGIQYAHDNGVIHRDLKPSNIMMDGNGDPKILDFGLARLTYGDLGTLMTATREGSVEGTPRYMSPEQARGLVNEIDERTDVYALGVILYELLTGQPPSNVTTLSPQTIDTICEEIPRRPSDIAADLGNELDAILLKALEKNPDRRYKTVAALGEDLGRYLDGKPISARSPSRLYILRKNVARKKSWVAAGAAAVLVIAAVIIWYPKPGLYDIAGARRAALEIRCKLLRNGPSAVVNYQAGQAPSRFPGLIEATLVQAQARYFVREHMISTQILTTGLARNPEAWPFQALKNEIRAMKFPSEAGVGDSLYWTDDLARSADAWYMRSFATLDISNALSWAREALKIDPRHELALAEVALLSEAAGDPEAALSASQALIDLGSSMARWSRFRVCIFLEMGRHEEALADCQRWVDNNPSEFYCHLIKGKVERLMRRYEDAERSFTRAIEERLKSDTMGPWLYFHRGTVRWLVNEKEGAISDYRKAYRELTHPNFGNARLFILLHEQGRLQEAEEALANARQDDIIEPWLIKVLDCLAGEVTPAELVMIAERAGDPIQMCEGYYYAGEAALLRGSTTEARMWFEKCVNNGMPSHPTDPTESVSEYELAEWRIAHLEK